MKWLMLALLRLYKLTFSPVFRSFGVRCRYHPDCANYSRDAIQAHGAWRGGWLTLARLCRCHPFERLGAGSGLDNVPDTLERAPVWAPWRYGVWRHRTSDHADTDIPRWRDP